MEIFIKGNVPSSKNSKIWTGRYLIWSKTAQRYKKDTAEDWKTFRLTFKERTHNMSLPLVVSFTFIRSTKHKFDYVNPLQTILDLMVEHGWIEDDNADIILPVFKKYKYDKENPGVIIQI